MARIGWRMALWKQLIGFGGNAGDVPTFVDATTAPTWQAPPSGSGGGAPTNASYVTLGTNASLSAERVLTAGTAISLTDGGANGNATVAVQLGTSGTTACAGNDSRLSDARTPTAHDAQHEAMVLARVSLRI